MRLWHKDLIEVLPKQQLLGQWRECCAIAKNIHDKGAPGHLLVNKIMGYDMIEFLAYSFLVHHTMLERGYSCDWEKYLKYYSPDIYDKIKVTWHHYSDGWLKEHHGIFSDLIVIEEFGHEIVYNLMSFDIFFGWHNYEYLEECYYNLREKWNCGGVPDVEWDRFEKRYSELKELYNEQN